MFRAIYHFILLQWRRCIIRTLQAWKSVLALVSGPLVSRYDPSVLSPLTAKQLDNQADEFVKAIDLEAVRTLASSYHDGSPCRIDEKETARGSYNICFFARFDNQTRVIRIPIQPVIHDIWGKLQSEVCTMRYIQENTQIPIPRVHAYGQAKLLRNNSAKQAFMILDHIKGQQLIEQKFSTSSEAYRRQFYSELVDILTQLRGLEFSAAGSLMPAQLEASGSIPAIIGAFSIPINKLKIQGYMPSPSPSRSTAKFFSQQRRLLRDIFSLPTQSLDKQTAELELFALDSIGKIPIAANHEYNPFVLSHTDLRWSNIMVDHELHITGIIDWEWAATVPANNFTPPSWITTSKYYFTEFHSILASKHGSSAHAQLLSEWDYEYAVTRRVAEIFRKPHHLVKVFYTFIYPQLYTEPHEEVIREYFLCKQKQLERQRLLQNSERYTKYLKENNLFVDNEEEVQRTNKWIAKVQAYYDSKQKS